MKAAECGKIETVYFLGHVRVAECGELKLLILLCAFSVLSFLGHVGAAECGKLKLFMMLCAFSIGVFWDTSSYIVGS